MDYLKKANEMLNDCRQYTYYEKLIKNRYSSAYKKVLSGNDIIICGLSPYAKDIIPIVKNNFSSKLEIIDSSKGIEAYEKNNVNNKSEVLKIDNDSVYFLTSSVSIGDFIECLLSNNISRDNIIPYHALPFLNDVFDGKKKTYSKSTFDAALNHILNNIVDYKDLFMYLSDSRSKEMLAKIILYRLTADIEYSYNIGTYDEDFYFIQDFISPDHNEIFVDAGGFCGDTLHSFIKCYNGLFKKYYFFEPDKELYEQVSQTTKNEKISYYNIGLFNNKQNLCFNTSEKGIGSINDEGDIVISVDTLDNILDGQFITYLKAVVEGSEIELLYGAQNTIVNFKPKIAIAAYHKPEHLLQICTFLHQCVPEYKSYIRSGFNSLYNYLTVFAIIP